jgi:hypothetical protein
MLKLATNAVFGKIVQFAFGRYGMMTYAAELR